MNIFCLVFLKVAILHALINKCKGDIYFDQPVKYGQATYYSGGMGSCGQSNTGYRVAAITVKYMGNPPRGNPNLAPLCAPQYCILVTGPVGSIVVKVSDTLGSGMGEDNIDLYDDVYTQVATKVLGRVIVAWKFVDCFSNPLGPTTNAATSVISSPTLTGGVITAGLISSGAISGGEIKAGSVSAGSVAANSILSIKPSNSGQSSNITPISTSNSRGTSVCTQDGIVATSDCTGFYHCIGQNASPKVTCPPGTLFDSTISNCNAASLVNCMSSSNPLPSLNSNSGSSSGSPYGASLNSVGASPNIPPGSTSNSGGNYTCTQDGIFATSDCSGFYHCISQQCISQVTCPPGTLFDSTISNCNHQDFVKCTSLDSDDLNINSGNGPSYNPSNNVAPNLGGSFTCNDDGLFVSAGCEGFYQCINTHTDTPIKMFTRCPSGTLFDKIISACNHQGLVKCESTISSPSIPQPDGFITAGSLSVTSLLSNSISVSAGSVQQVILKPSDNFSFVCPSDGYFPILPSCQHYVQCAQTNTLYAFRGLLTCPEGTIFDSTIKTCNWKSQTICS